MSIGSHRQSTLTPALNSPHAKHRLDTGTERVRLDLDDELTAGLWWPRSTDYAAEIHDLAYSCGLALGQRVERITFAWNHETIERLRTIRLSGLLLGDPADGQPREEMHVYAVGGHIVRLTVVPPAAHGVGSHAAPRADYPAS
ncbi:DUF5994 family protein [Tsukamurella tyrosinosolvens]|uniref:DUF5994 family protein n=1 Tax=Tsukamurella tyrosinosolvens TaxID=57704 RepID=UPI000C7EBC1D|nr:DUF5994 family protein [Tsukamurella tyrosinosolvens]AUN38621.1 hypothetical protein ASU32_00190 [Tsukamurella tyrosinosolvens]